MSWAMCAERSRLVSAPAWRIAAKAPATSAITSPAVMSRRTVATRFPGMRVVARDILVDGDKVAVRSAVEGTGTSDGDAQPMLLEIFRVEDGRLAEMWGSTWFPRVS
jgi:SnoaL-like protein